MAKVELKTKKNKKSVSAFLNSISDSKKRKEAKALLKIMKEATKERPMMWGDSIVGFGEYDYKYASGREGTWMITGFSPRKQALTVYIMPGYSFPDYKKILKKLGPHKLGKSCLYLKSLEEIDLKALKKLISLGYKEMKKKA